MALLYRMLCGCMTVQVNLCVWLYKDVHMWAQTGISATERESGEREEGEREKRKREESEETERAERGEKVSVAHTLWS